MKTTAIALVIMLAGCAGADYRPLVDWRKSPPNYETDLAECQQYARGEAGVGSSVALGAVVGALAGALLATALGGDSDTGASIGAGAVGAQAGIGADDNMRSIINRCMTGRGYSVLR